MATKYTNIETALTNPKDRYDGKIRSGKIQLTRATWTPDGTDVQNNVVNIVTLPVGAMVIPHLSQLSMESSAANGSPVLDLSIGDGGDADRYMLATDVKAGGTFVFAQDGLSPATRPAGCTPYYLRSGSNIVKATITSSAPNATATTGSTVVFDIAWVHGGTNPTE